MDTGARSVWVDLGLLRLCGGDIISLGGEAVAVDGERIYVVGEGVFPWFRLFDAVFRDIRVRAMRKLPSLLPIGLAFWDRYSLCLGLCGRRSEITVNGEQLRGEVCVMPQKPSLDEGAVSRIEEMDAVVDDR